MVFTKTDGFISEQKKTCSGKIQVGFASLFDAGTLVLSRPVHIALSLFLSHESGHRSEEPTIQIVCG